MGCNSPGATHHSACDCREDAICKEVAGLRERLAAAEKAREEADAYAGRANARIADLGERLDATEAVLRDAESRAASLSRELLAATKARNCADERAQTMRLMLDTIEGWATGQPGKMPTAVEDGWSTALSAAVARVAAAESRAARLEEKAKKTLPLLCFAFGFIGSIVECKDARFATSLPHLAQWTEEAGAAIAAEEGK